MIAEGLGALDKSGVAELTFEDRHKYSGDRVRVDVGLRQQRTRTFPQSLLTRIRQEDVFQ